MLNFLNIRAVVSLSQLYNSLSIIVALDGSLLLRIETKRGVDQYSFSRGTDVFIEHIPMLSSHQIYEYDKGKQPSAGRFLCPHCLSMAARKEQDRGPGDWGALKRVSVELFLKDFRVPR